MASKEETKFWNRIRPQLKPLGWFFKTQMLARLGIPDVIGVINGRFVALELKATSKGHGGETERLQQFTLKQIAAHGGYAKTVWPEIWPEIHKDLLLLSRSRENV